MCINIKDVHSMCINIKDVHIFSCWLSLAHSKVLEREIKEFILSSQTLTKNDIRKFLISKTNFRFFNLDEIYNFFDFKEIDPQDVVDGMYCFKDVRNMMFDDILKNLIIDLRINY